MYVGNAACSGEHARLVDELAAKKREPGVEDRRSESDRGAMHGRRWIFSEKDAPRQSARSDAWMGGCTWSTGERTGHGQNTRFLSPPFLGNTTAAEKQSRLQASYTAAAVLRMHDQSIRHSDSGQATNHTKAKRDSAVLVMAAMDVR
jgi:hypothetical protein